MTTRRWITFGFLLVAGCGESTPPPSGTAGTRPAANQGTLTPPSRPGWTTHKSPGGRFAVLMPGTPQVTAHSGRLFTKHSISCDYGGANFSVIYFDPPPRSVAPDVVEATMRRDREVGIQNLQGTLKSETKLTIQKDGHAWPGVESVMENAAGLYTARLYAVGGRMYTLQVTQPKNQDHQADTAKFFDSFAVEGDSVPRS